MDRNNVLQCNTVIDGQSLSARRAWIETLVFWVVKKKGGSLSARRAWIETNMFRQVLAF